MFFSFIQVNKRKKIIKISKSEEESISRRNENTKLLAELTFINFLRDRLERSGSWKMDEFEIRVANLKYLHNFILFSFKDYLFI